MRELFAGGGTALVTPLEGGKVDFVALERLMRRQIEGGIRAIIILGTTGEPATLTRAEKREIIRFARKVADGETVLIAGTGGNNTASVIEDSLQARDEGADGLLIVTPYYNKCTQNGLIEHYRVVAEAVSCPIIAYNVPSRTGLSFKPETVVRLSENPYIYGYKEASPDMSHNLAVLRELKGKVAVYSGEDSYNYLYMAAGAQGVISVTANVFPRLVADVCGLCLKGDYEGALNLQNRLYEVNRELFCEVNPIPVKAALKYLGLASEEMRLPLTTIEENNRQRVIEAVEKVIETLTKVNKAEEDYR